MNAVESRTLRNTPIEPYNYDHLWRWIMYFTGIGLARTAVCKGHHAPFDAFATVYFDRPSNVLILGSRGSGKSMCSALQAHMACRFASAPHSARIMGGSLQQSGQIYNAIDEFIIRGRGELGSDGDQVKAFLSHQAKYINGSEIRMLAASTKSARGPHVPDLFLDEVDEFNRKIFESAIGMAQAKNASKTRIVMTSTWHNETGLMGEQIERSREFGYPFFQFCVFEVLERCPEWRSGPDLENCPACPIVRWCHEDIDDYGEGIPKAKRSDGHYTIDSFIQKVLNLSIGAVESDFLCRGPKAEGIWFRHFAADNIVTDQQISRYVGEYHPEFRVHIPIDYGVCTGAVAFQVRKRQTPHGITEDIHIFADYYSDGLSAAENAAAIRADMEAAMGGRPIGSEDVRVLMDPAGGDRNPIGPTGIVEYARGGIRRIRWWPRMQHRKMESLALLDTFIRDGSGEPHLFIHPRCKMTIDAFRNYRRKKVGQIFVPVPEDPQHPWEEIVDSIAGGLLDLYPNGRKIERRQLRAPVGRLIG
jgi:hypothetical protein